MWLTSDRQSDLFIHSFIHYGDLYSAPSRLLLRLAPDPCTAKKKSFEARVECVRKNHLITKIQAMNIFNLVLAFWQFADTKLEKMATEPMALVSNCCRTTASSNFEVTADGTDLNWLHEGFSNWGVEYNTNNDSDFQATVWTNAITSCNCTIIWCNCCASFSRR